MNGSPTVLATPAPIPRTEKTGQKRLVPIEGHGLMATGSELAGPSRHESYTGVDIGVWLSRFGSRLPDQITVNLDASYDTSPMKDTMTILNCGWKLSPQGIFAQIYHAKRYETDRTNSWPPSGLASCKSYPTGLNSHNMPNLAPADSIIILVRLRQEAGLRFRLDTTLSILWLPLNTICADVVQVNIRDDFHHAWAHELYANKAAPRTL